MARKRKITELDLVKEIMYWALVLKMPPFVIKRNDKMHWAGYVYIDIKKKRYILHYNLKYMKQYPQLIQSIIFHEFGHIKYETEKFNDYVRSEYLAERYSIKMIKKHCPKQYKYHLRHFKELLKNKGWCKENPRYKKAFEKVYRRLI